MALSYLCSRLAAKLAVSGIIELVVDMATYLKREMIPNALGIPFPFLYISLILLLRHNTEIRSFAYYGTRWEDCEGMSCSYPLGEDRVDIYRLI